MKKTRLLFCAFLVLLACKKEKQVVTKITAKTIAIDASTTSDSSIVKTIAPYKKKMIAEINTVLTVASKNLMRTDGKLESTLGNLLADLSYKRANPIFYKQTHKNIDFAMFNYGGIRAGITKGTVTNKNAFELMPFDNKFVVVELSGDKVLELVQYLIKNKLAHPLSKQFRLTTTKKGFNLTINHKKFNPKKTYFVLTTNYLQTGGDQMNFFKNPIKLYNLDYKMRDAIIDYFKSVKRLTSSLDGRFKSN